MSANQTEIESQISFEETLSGILKEGTLYRPFNYAGSGLHHASGSELGTVRCAFLPKQFKMFCPTCCGDQLWEIVRHSRAFYFRPSSTEPECITYSCRNCGREQQHYWIEWLGLDSSEQLKSRGRFTKVGQWPPLSIEPSSDLARSLGKEDTRLYKKALISSSISHGVAALAYFRRVIENKVDDLIDLIAEAAKSAQASEEELQQIEQIKAGRHVDQKIDFAKRILPPSLKPGGINPLDKLYGIASAGLHGESEEQCLELFAEYRSSFEYLFRNLTFVNTESRAFVDQMSKPSPAL